MEAVCSPHPVPQLPPAPARHQHTQALPETSQLSSSCQKGKAAGCNDRHPQLQQHGGHLSISIWNQHWKHSADEVLLPFWNAVLACPSKAIAMCYSSTEQWGSSPGEHKSHPCTQGLLPFYNPDVLNIGKISFFPWDFFCVGGGKSACS